MTMIRPEAIVIHEDDTLAELVEAWANIARTVPSEARTRRCDALCDEISARRNQHTNSATE